MSAHHKRIYRHCGATGLALEKVKAQRYGEPVPIVVTETVYQFCSLNLIRDSLSSRRRLTFLMVADDFTGERVQMAVDFSIGAEFVMWRLDKVAKFRCYPQAVRTDNGAEFIAKAFLAWAQSHQIERILIQSVFRTQNAYIESFNGRAEKCCFIKSVDTNMTR
jgi:putative transposase